MKNISWLIALLALLCVACNNQKKNNEIELSSDMIAAVDSTASFKTNLTLTNGNNAYSSKAATITSIDSAKKFIRTAQIKSKVNNVLQATINIEDATVKFGGFVTNSSLQSSINKIEKVDFTPDSLQEQIYYTTTNTIVCRVPNYKLDTLLKEIGKNLVFIDYRNIKAEDISFDLLRTSLIQKRTEAYSKRMNKIADDNATKPIAINNIADGIIEKQEQQDDALLDKLSKQDAVAYSTITLELYQHENLIQHAIPNMETQKNEISFFSKAIKNIQKGWYGLLYFISFLLQLWPVILLGFLVWFLLKKIVKPIPKKNQ